MVASIFSFSRNIFESLTTVPQGFQQRYCLTHNPDFERPPAEKHFENIAGK